MADNAQDCSPDHANASVAHVAKNVSAHGDDAIATRLIATYGVETVIAALAPVLTDERKSRLEAVLDARLASLTVVLENLHDPRNGAAAVRSIEAMGLSAMHIVESLEPFRFTSGVTRGCEKWIDLYRYPRFQDCRSTLKSQGFTLLAASPDGEATLDDVDVSTPVALVFGNEHDGLPQETMTLCDQRVRIPMYGFTQSFNLSVSVAVSIYQLASRRRQHIGALGDIDQQKRAFLRARWYVLGVRGVETIVARHVSKQTLACAEAEPSP